jgi:hypothetical protein
LLKLVGNTDFLQDSSKKKKVIPGKLFDFKTFNRCQMGFVCALSFCSMRQHKVISELL